MVHTGRKREHTCMEVCVCVGGGGVHSEVVRLTLIKAKMLSIADLACSFPVL